MKRILLIFIFACCMQSCRYMAFSPHSIVFKDDIATVYLVQNKAFFDGMALYLKIDDRIFDGVGGEEPFYKKTDKGYLFFTYSLAPADRHQILTVNFYDPGKRLNTQSGPFTLQYYFSPERDKFELENNTLTIYPARGLYQRIVFDLDNNVLRELIDRK